tara:strand:+ start:325 stop:603 length:279 start_codon:yes stop_codon:yes gene_type:complete
MLFEAFMAARPLTRIAALLFVLGKLFCFFTIFSAFISQAASSVCLFTYIACIVGAIVLSLVDMSKIKKEAKTPSIEQVRKWAQQHGLKLGDE